MPLDKTTALRMSSHDGMQLVPMATIPNGDGTYAQIAEPFPSLRDGQLLCAKITLGAAGVVTTISLPSWIHSLMLSKTAPDGRYNVDAAPAAEAALSGASLAYTSFAAGNYIWSAEVISRRVDRNVTVLQMIAVAGAEVWYLNLW